MKQFFIWLACTILLSICLIDWSIVSKALYKRDCEKYREVSKAYEERSDIHWKRIDSLQRKGMALLNAYDIKGNWDLYLQLSENKDKEMLSYRELMDSSNLYYERYKDCRDK